MIWILLKGIGVGLAVAAPVGPIALLCIRRTLEHGWRAGVVSGLGVASADATYGLMVAAGLSATGLLVAWAGPMQLAGGLLIAVIGARSIRAGLAPRAGEAASGGGGRGLLAAATSAYVLTIANPMTILTFAGLVAGLGGTVSAGPAAPYLLVSGVFLGSLAWWTILAGATALARTRISTRLTRWLDLASGAVLVGWGLRIAARALAGL